MGLDGYNLWIYRFLYKFGRGDDFTSALIEFPVEGLMAGRVGHRSVRKIAWVAIVFLVCRTGLTQPVTLVERVESLGDQQGKWSMLVSTIQASPDNAHVIYTAWRNKLVSVVFDDARGTVYDQIVGPRVSPDSQRHAYLGRRDSLWWFVVDGKTVLGRRPHSEPFFSPDSGRVAFWAMEGDTPFLTIDGQDHPVFDQVVNESLRFSADSSRLAYFAQKDQYWFVVDQNGKRGPRCEKVAGTAIFSPDSSRLAYAAKYNGQAVVVVDGGIGVGYERIGAGPIFSPDSQHVAYWAQRSDGRWALVFDGEEDPNYEADDYEGLVFSEDSSRIASFIKREGKWRVIVDGQAGISADAMGRGSLVFSPDSGQLAYGAMKGRRWFAMKNRQEQPSYKRLLAGSVRFSPDSKRLAYCGYRDGQWFVVVDGYEHRGFDKIWTDSLRFSPDSSNLVYVAVADSKPRVVVDGRMCKARQDVTIPRFSSDSSHVVWLARSGSRWRAVVDGIEGNYLFSEPIPGAEVVFDSPREFHTVVISRPGPKFYRLDVRIQQPVSVSVAP